MSHAYAHRAQAHLAALSEKGWAVRIAPTAMLTAGQTSAFDQLQVVGNDPKPRRLEGGWLVT